MTRQIARDIERKVIESVQDTMKRELAIAEHVMEPAEIGMLLMLIAKGTVMTAAATIAGMSDDRGATFDAMLDLLIDQVRREKPSAMDEVAKKYASVSR